MRPAGTTLDTLDPEAALDDLEPLRDVIGDARVVALGESSHHIREFYRVRHRVLRFLVERCGFGVYALEGPYTQGQALDAWVRGGSGTVEEAAETGIAMSLGQCREMHETLTWIRRWNERPGGPSLGCVGTDLPGAFGSPLPALEALSGYPDTLKTATDLVRRFHDPVTMRTFARYQELGPGDQDALISALSQLTALMRRDGGTSSYSFRPVIDQAN